MSAININFEILLGVFTFLITTYLGAVVYFKNRGSWTGRLFALLALLVDVYIVVNYLSLHPPQNTPSSQLFWIRIVMFVCSFIGPALICLVHTFPRARFTLKARYLMPMLLLMFTSAYASITTLVFKSIEYPGGMPMPVPGPGIPVFFVDFVGLFILSFIILIYKYKKSSDEERAGNFIFLLGVIFTFSFMAVSTVIAVVILKTSTAVFLGPLSSVILMSFITYAILRHRLFNVKIVATEILVAVIWMILFSEVFTSSVPNEKIVDALIFVATVPLGLFLIRSVVKEVKQREELQTISEQLRQANLRLQELDKQKTDFLSIASHQLRTPLSIFKGYIELIQDGAYGQPSKEMAEVLSNFEINNEHLIKLVDEFLNASRIEQGRTNWAFARHNLAGLIGETINELKAKAAVKKMEIIWHGLAGPSEAVMDREKIYHVVYNFVDNAIKYSDQGKVSVALKKEGDGYALRVKDEGIGFGKVDGANFFQKFYRGENVKGINVNGTGLGLYICAKFIEGHHGRIWARSRGLGKGSEFGFWIPVKPTKAG